MAVFEIQVNGAWVDFSGMVQRSGYDYESNDLDGPDSGREMDGLMDREFIAEKLKFSFTVMPAPESQYAALKNALKQSKFIQCRVKSLGETVQKTFYCTSFKAKLREDVGSDPIWENGAFEIVEQ